MTAVEDGARHGVARELDDAIRAVVVRFIAHAGEAEATEPPAPSRGLRGARLGGDPAATRVIPRRYVLPVGALA